MTVGLFSSIKNFNASRKQKKIEKSGRLVRNSKAIKEDRMAALEFLKELDDPDVAVPILLERFEYSLEHGINDAREKEVAVAGILRHGEKALPHVKAHLQKTTRIAWPIKVLTKLTNEGEVSEILLSCLNFGDVSFDQAIVDKNYDILCYLADYKAPNLIDRVTHFLKDPDERVRFAAVEVLVQFNDEKLRASLEPFIADESAENRRIRMAVIDAFVRYGWQLSDPKKYGDGPLVEGIFVTKRATLERRV